MIQIWMNGKTYPPDAPLIGPKDRGLLLGDGVFDTSLAINGVVMYEEDHIARLRHDADSLGIDIPYTNDEITTAISHIVPFKKTVAVRTTVTRGSGGRGLTSPDETPEPTVIISATPYTPPQEPVKIIISSIRRNEYSPTSRIKSLNYLDHILARREAIAAGASDALMLNTSDHIVCATAGNVFAVMDNTLVTPPITDGCLPGITRKVLLSLAKDLNIKTQEKSLNPNSTYEEMFLTNSLTGIRSLENKDGPITQKLKGVYQERIARFCKADPIKNTIRPAATPGTVSNNQV